MLKDAGSFRYDSVMPFRLARLLKLLEQIKATTSQFIIENLDGVD